MAKKKTTRKTTKKTTSKRSAPKKTVKKKPVAKRTTGKKKNLIQRLIAVFKTEEKKKKRQNSSARNEFRYNNQTKHPNYIFEESNGKYRSLGVTHQERTFGKQNMPLDKNPKKGEEKKAYIRNGVISAKKSNYSKKTINNMSFNQSDYKNVKSKIRNYKKNRKKKSQTCGKK